MKTSTIRTYSELIQIPTFEERVEYLLTKSSVGVDTFGHDRYLNQRLYKSRQWLRIRDEVIARDLGRDLAVPGYEIFDGDTIIVHHMNPITIDDVVNGSELVFDPEYLITTKLPTHNIIHYGSTGDLLVLTERRPNDTCPWK